MLFKIDVKLIILIRVVKIDGVTKEHTPFSFKVSSINVHRLTTKIFSLFLFLLIRTQKYDALLCVVFIIFQKNCHSRCSVFSIMARTEDKFSFGEKGFGICLIYELKKPLA